MKIIYYKDKSSRHGVVMYSVYRGSLLKGIHNFVHLNLTIALAIALIVFIAGMETARGSNVSIYTGTVLVKCCIHCTGLLHNCCWSIALLFHICLHLDVV